jgi:putative SbcD/Mre11-related phosphoesterase
MLLLKLDKKRVGIIADTHIGFVRSLNKKGIFIEDNQTEMIIKTLSVCVPCVLENRKNKKLDLLVINGDFFHEFSKIDYSVIKSAKEIISFILENISEKLVIIKGNHDKIIAQLFHELKVKNKVELKNNIKIGNFEITHGDEIINVATNRTEKENNKTITIIGHEHPAVRLYSKTRYEEYKAFLINPKLIVLPSFNTIIEGHDIIREKNISPYLLRLSREEFLETDVYLATEKKIAKKIATTNMTNIIGKEKTREKTFELKHFHKIKDIISMQ